VLVEMARGLSRKDMARTMKLSDGKSWVFAREQPQ
jgi:hypothetical protein|tara:strand:+ start:6122 stop:6226 length:105 start_codon:yes stop_codon:yes gene_type:complete